MRPGDAKGSGAGDQAGGELILTDRGRSLDFHGRKPREAELWALLESVPDPEVPVVSVVDLGIVREIVEHQGGWEISVTPTYSGCPATELIEQEIQLALERAGVSPVRIRRRLSPPWTTDWISAAGREKLRAYGIAPPVGDSRDGEAAPSVACPRCGSLQTRKISEFGSTACKALYQCETCLEPFDYFKCI